MQQNVQQKTDVQTETTSIDPQKIQMDPKAEMIRDKLQQDVVNIITKKLETGEMTEERAKAIAQMTLSKLPEGISYRNLMIVIPTLDDEFEELRAAVYPIIHEYQQKMAQQIQIEISKLVKERRLGEALDLANKTIKFEETLG